MCSICTRESSVVYKGRTPVIVFYVAHYGCFLCRYCDVFALRTRLITCDEHPKKMTAAQAANPRSDVPSEVRLLLRQCV